MFTAEDVKKLREMTGVGMMDCKKALQETDGNIEKVFEAEVKEEEKVEEPKKATKKAKKEEVDA